MKKKIFFVFFLFVLFFVSSATILKAQNITNTIDGLNKTAKSVTAFQEQTSSGIKYDSSFLASKAGQIISLILSFVGVLFLGLMIYAGISWMTSNGNEQTVTTAKNIIINSTIGIIIVFAAYALISFLGTEVLNSNTEIQTTITQQN